MGPSLQELENEVWGAPEFQSGLVLRCHELWTKPIADFSIGDLQLMIGQKFGQSYLVPQAIAILDDDPLAEGDYYPGDLLSSILTIDSSFWDARESEARRMASICGRIFPVLTSEDGALTINCENFISHWELRCRHTREINK